MYKVVKKMLLKSELLEQYKFRNVGEGVWKIRLKNPDIIGVYTRQKLTLYAMSPDAIKNFMSAIGVKRYSIEYISEKSDSKILSFRSIFEMKGRK